MKDTVIIANFSGYEVEENVMVPESRLMNNTRIADLLESGKTFTIHSSILPARLPAGSVLVLKPETGTSYGYTPYKRID